MIRVWCAVDSLLACVDTVYTEIEEESEEGTEVVLVDVPLDTFFIAVCNSWQHLLEAAGYESSEKMVRQLLKRQKQDAH
jgi:hypothetical protein